MPVMISRSGEWPCRTTRARPSSVSRSAWRTRKAATSASTAWASRVRAPLRRTSVSGSTNDPGWTNLTTLSLDTAYPPSVEKWLACAPPRYAAFTPSRRHQLPRIALGLADEMQGCVNLADRAGLLTERFSGRLGCMRHDAPSTNGSLVQARPVSAPAKDLRK